MRRLIALIIAGLAVIATVFVMLGSTHAVYATGGNEGNNKCVGNSDHTGNQNDQGNDNQGDEDTSTCTTTDETSTGSSTTSTTTTSETQTTESSSSTTSSGSTTSSTNSSPSPSSSPTAFVPVCPSGPHVLVADLCYSTSQCAFLESTLKMTVQGCPVDQKPAVVPSSLGREGGGATG